MLHGSKFTHNDAKIKRGQRMGGITDEVVLTPVLKKDDFLFHLLGDFWKDECCFAIPHKDKEYFHYIFHFQYNPLFTKKGGQILATCPP